MKEAFSDYLQQRPLSRGLARPTNFYAALRTEREGGVRHVQSMIPVRYAKNLEKKLEKRQLAPTEKWFDERADFVQPPANPTLEQATPKGKGGAGRRYGNVRAAFVKSMAFGFEDAPTPYTPNVRLGHEPRKPEYAYG